MWQSILFQGYEYQQARNCTCSKNQSSSTCILLIKCACARGLILATGALFIIANKYTFLFSYGHATTCLAKTMNDVTVRKTKRVILVANP